MHCLPADITDVSCGQGEVSAEVFEQYRIPTYQEASYKPFVIAAMIFLARIKDPGAKLEQKLGGACSINCHRETMSRIIKTFTGSGQAHRQALPPRGIVIPTFQQMREPGALPPSVKARLKGVGLWDVDPANLFRITWKNDLQTGLFGGVNYLEIPPAITGVKARIIGLVGKYFPTGAHKVGAAFGCLVPRLVSGEFDPEIHKAVWPSTGNYCRGGAFDCALLGCTAIAILPEEMCRERFDWLQENRRGGHRHARLRINVKEIYDKCWELKKDPINVIFNQFEEFGNPIFHYNVTGPAFEEVLAELGGDAGSRRRPTSPPPARPAPSPPATTSRPSFRA